MAFLPVTKKEMLERGWERPDFVYISGDAYVDHPSFGAAIICRVLESHGYKVCFIPQPNWRTTEDFTRFGEPRLGFLVSAGNIDSMVNHYTVAKKRRKKDAIQQMSVCAVESFQRKERQHDSKRFEELSDPE